MKRKTYAAMLYIIQLSSKIGRTRLVKMLFLSDYNAKEVLGHTITDLSYKRYHYGPYSEDIISALKKMGGYEIKEKTFRSRHGGRGYSYVEGDNPRIDTSSLNSREKEVIEEVVNNYMNKSLDELLEDVYSLDEVDNADQLEKVL